MKLHRWFIAIFFIAITISGLGFFKFQQIQAAMDMAAAFPEPSATVNTHLTETSRYKPSYEVTGQVVATKIIDIQNELSGVIEQVNFAAGAVVEQGQLLLSQITAEEQAQLSSAKATLKLSKSNFIRMEKLLKSNKVSQQEFDRAAAELAIAKANITNLESVIDKKQIYAPFTGSVGLHSYQKGQFLAANTQITSLVGQGPEIWVDFQLAQTQTRLKIGDTVFVRSISHQSTAQLKPAKIIAVNSQIKAKSRHLQYRAELSQGSQWLNHNEIVKVQIGEPSANVVLVPSSAIVRDHFGTFVYELIKDDNAQYRAKKVIINAGSRDGKQQIVLNGLGSGTLIATDGAFKLREGLLVYPKALPETNLSAQLLNGVTK